MKSADKKFVQINPEINAALTQQEMAAIRYIAADYLRLVGPAENVQKPNWLLVNWNDPTWRTMDGKRTRYLDGNWVGTIDVCWRYKLSNGSCLTDHVNVVVLEACRQAASLYRDGFGAAKPPALTTWKHFCYSVKSLAGWLFLQEARFSPTTMGFSLLDQASLRELFVQIGSGGWTDANRLRERCMEQFYVNTFSEPYSIAIDLSVPLPDDLVAPICSWLKLQGAYGIKARGLISREFLSELIGVDIGTLGGASVRFMAFLRQFEPEAHSPNRLLISSSRDREFPSHRTKVIDTALSKAVSFGTAKFLARDIGVLLKLYQRLPEQLIRPDSINIGELKSLARTYTEDIKRTPFMPVDTGMRYLDEALFWVEKYGDALIEYFLLAMETVINVCAPYAVQKSARSKRVEKLMSQLPIPKELAMISSGFNRIAPNLRSFDFDRRRRSPSLHEALETLIGAIVVVICTLKPTRISEITNLDRDCLSFNGYYYINFDLAKRTVAGFRAAHGAPIPAIAAKAIKQMQRLGDGLMKQCDEKDDYYRTKLFVLPSRYFGERKVIHSRLLDRYLDIFCDHVNLPPDEYGRRWYVRVHELRKWTLLLLFWSGQEAVLDAASELAGHTNHEHIRAYIALEFPGETRSSLEALYVADRLVTRTGFDDGDEVFHELHRKVLEHFHAGFIDLIPEREVQSYLRTLAEQDEFHVEPFYVDIDQNRRQLRIALRKGARK